MRIAVCDAGVGNVRSVLRAVDRAAPGAELSVTADPDAIRRADKIVVPGQGSFGAFATAMRGGLGEALVERIRAGTPYLGICLGLQVLFDESEEAPGERGLGIFRGRVRRLDVGKLPLPHIGWNVATPTGNARARAVLGDAARFFYFAHSFAAFPDDSSVIAATTDYGGTFTSVIAKDAVFAVQFHPEKSQREGIALLERFFA